MKIKHCTKVCSLIFIMVLIPYVFFSFSAEAQNEYYHRDYSWSYRGTDWTASLDIPRYLYDSYKRVSVSTRLQYQSSGYGFLTTTDDPYLNMIAEKLEEKSSEKGYDSYDEVSFVLAFIQSLPYTSDSVTSGYDEYPRFPLETLVDNGGDCEDTSILFATLTLIMGYGTIYINPPEHYAVGILGEEGIPGYYWTYNGGRYYYCETTGYGWRIGDLPDEYKNVEATLYRINEAQQYNPDSSGSSETSNLLNFALMIFVIAGLIGVIALIVSITSRKAIPSVQAERFVAEAGSAFNNNYGPMYSKFCRYCGAQVRSDSVFCEKCGKDMR